MKVVIEKRRSAQTRRGITIIEVLIVVTGVSMMLGLCAVSIQLLMRLSGDGVARYGATVALERLARQLRDDAHSSDSGQSGADNKAESSSASLRLTLEPDHLIVYQSDHSAVVRTERMAGKAVRRESYSLAAGVSAQFLMRKEGPSRLVAMVVSRGPGKSLTEPPRPLEVLAQIGKDRPRTSEKTGARSR
jgi:hypothetical protein